MHSFSYIKFRGALLNPDRFSGREPSFEEVYELYRKGELVVEIGKHVSAPILADNGQSETLWLSQETYDAAGKILATSRPSEYEAHEGASFSTSKGAWMLIDPPQPVKCPPGIPGRCVRVQTVLGQRLGLPPFVVEERFVFKGFKGEDIDVGRIKRYRYFIAPYSIVGGRVELLGRERLRNTLLFKNYLSRIIGVLEGVSKHYKSRAWSIERFNSNAVAKYKVVWRDVASQFIPAVVDDGSIPDYTVNYIVTSGCEESYYLLAVLLAPQINRVVRELHSWIGHVQPRFIRYFSIPKYNPHDPIHKRLSEIGKKITENGIVEEIKEIKHLVEQL